METAPLYYILKGHDNMTNTNRDVLTQDRGRK